MGYKRIIFLFVCLFYTSFVWGYCHHNDRYYSDEFGAYQKERFHIYKKNYEHYNADLATGDDDTFKNPDMLIN